MKVKFQACERQAGEEKAVMSMSDPIADMLTRIRNAVLVRKKTVNVRASKVCEGIAKVLKEEGYIEDYVRIDAPLARRGKKLPGSLLRIYLRYGPQGERIITEIKRVSKPGRRFYANVKDLPRPLAGLGIAIVSTSKGILSDRQCRKENVGGEVLCTVS